MVDIFKRQDTFPMQEAGRRVLRDNEVQRRARCKYCGRELVMVAAGGVFRQIEMRCEKHGTLMPREIVHSLS